MPTLLRYRLYQLPIGYGELVDPFAHQDVVGDVDQILAALSESFHHLMGFSDSLRGEGHSHLAVVGEGRYRLWIDTKDEVMITYTPN